jgi:hypothetical protein
MQDRAVFGDCIHAHFSLPIPKAEEITGLNAALVFSGFIHD